MTPNNRMTNASLAGDYTEQIRAGVKTACVIDDPSCCLLHLHPQSSGNIPAPLLTGFNCC